MPICMSECNEKHDLRIHNTLSIFVADEPKLQGANLLLIYESLNGISEFNPCKYLLSITKINALLIFLECVLKMTQICIVCFTDHRTFVISASKHVVYQKCSSRHQNNTMYVKISLYTDLRVFLVI